MKLNYPLLIVEAVEKKQNDPHGMVQIRRYGNEAVPLCKALDGSLQKFQRGLSVRMQEPKNRISFLVPQTAEALEAVFGGAGEFAGGPDDLFSLAE